MAFSNQDTNLVLPNGAQTGPRIVLDGDAGKLTVYGTTDDNRIEIDASNVDGLGHPIITFKTPYTDADTGITTVTDTGPTLVSAPKVSGYDSSVTVRSIVAVEDSQVYGGREGDGGEGTVGGYYAIGDIDCELGIRDHNVRQSFIGISEIYGIRIQSSGAVPDLRLQGKLYKSALTDLPLTVNQKGVTTVSFTGTSYTNTINFGTAFQTGRTPVVFMNINDSSASTLRAMINTYSVSNTGFSYRIVHAGGSSMTFSGVSVQWIAIDAGDYS